MPGFSPTWADVIVLAEEERRSCMMLAEMMGTLASPAT